MKKTMLMALLGTAALTLAGCASMWPATPGYVEVIDQQKIQLVERWARTNNAQVIWITAPTHKVPATGS